MPVESVGVQSECRGTGQVEELQTGTGNTYNRTHPRLDLDTAGTRCEPETALQDYDIQKVEIGPGHGHQVRTRNASEIFNEYGRQGIVGIVVRIEHRHGGVDRDGLQVGHVFALQEAGNRYVLGHPESVHVGFKGAAEQNSRQGNRAAQLEMTGYASRIDNFAVFENRPLYQQSSRRADIQNLVPRR